MGEPEKNKCRWISLPALPTLLIVTVSVVLLEFILRTGEDWPLSLETAMITQFGSNDGENYRFTMTAISGGAVFALVLGMATYMIIHATKYLKQMEEIEHE